jgi:hypothetical protein
MTSGVLTVVLVSEVGCLVGYGAVCTCSADMLEEVAASIFGYVHDVSQIGIFKVAHILHTETTLRQVIP